MKNITITMPSHPCKTISDMEEGNFGWCGEYLIFKGVKIIAILNKSSKGVTIYSDAPVEILPPGTKISFTI